MMGDLEKFYRLDETAQRLRDKLALDFIDRFGAIVEPGDVALTIAWPDQRGAYIGAHYRGDQPIYPASVCKLFYAVAVQAWLEQGTLSPDREIDRALTAMLRESSNDATHFLIDCLSGTSGGPYLSTKQLEEFAQKRDAVNGYFKQTEAPEFKRLNLTQKTYEEGPYGREWHYRYCYRQDGYDDNRNYLTTDAVARLWATLYRQQSVSPARDAALLQLLCRDPAPERLKRRPDNQIEGFFGQGLPPGLRLWSKAGWTSNTRHDSAIIGFPDGRHFVLAVFTEGARAAENASILPYIANKACALVTDVIPLPAVA